jgi:hypothetical protein
MQSWARAGIARTVLMATNVLLNDVMGDADTYICHRQKFSAPRGSVGCYGEIQLIA